ncbi:hypothetical protein MNBD_GAMMA09-2713 [hydrothermal vent metagenome]|uniref:Cyclic nucleotide-binding domain-containing protein n=1 Tax=hydrothermal vent metagenome TaxID=652676 RepID=A0A3B0XYW2_9ZZZZ
MYHTFKVPPKCTQLWQECHRLIPELLSGVKAKQTNLSLSAEESIDLNKNAIYLIKEGMAKEVYDGHIIVFYETGDLMGADSITIPKTTTIENDYSVIVDEYDGEEFLQHIFSDKEKSRAWINYLSCVSQCNKILMSNFSKIDTHFYPEFQDYQEGDIIIEEGTEDDDVFTLLSGTAQVLKGDTIVGEIKTDEIFGAIAALTKTRRTASVIASSDCSTLIVQREHFKELLISRPDTVNKLIEDMAKTITSLNEKIVAYNQK